MTTLPEEAVTSAADAAHEELMLMAKQMNVPMEYTQSISVNNYRVMRAALTAAAPHLEAVRMKSELDIAIEAAKRGEFKALYWYDVQAVCSWCYAKSAVGEYSIDWTCNIHGQMLTYPDGKTAKFYTRDEAKAAAQADYERRILSALEPSAARELALEEGFRKGTEAAAKLIECGCKDLLHGKGECQFPGNCSLEDAAAIRALSSPDHADAGKVEGDGKPVAYLRPKDIERLAKPGVTGAINVQIANVPFIGCTVPVFAALPSAPSEGAE